MRLCVLELCYGHISRACTENGTSREVNLSVPDQGFDEWYGIPNTTDESVYSSLEGFAESGITETFVFRLLDQKRVTRRRGAVQ